MKNLIFCLVLFILASCEISDIERVPDDQVTLTAWFWRDPNSEPGTPIYSVLEFSSDGTVFISYKINKTELVTEVGLFEYIPYKDGYMIFEQNGLADVTGQKSQMKDGKLTFGGRVYEKEKT